MAGWGRKNAIPPTPVHSVSYPVLHNLGEVLLEKLAPFGPRLVRPVEERDVGDLPAEGSEKSGFKFRSAVDDIVTARHVSEEVRRAVDFDGSFRFGIGEVERDAFLRDMFEFVGPAHLYKHRRYVTL